MVGGTYGTIGESHTCSARALGPKAFLDLVLPDFLEDSLEDVLGLLPGFLGDVLEDVPLAHLRSCCCGGHRKGKWDPTRVSRPAKAFVESTGHNDMRCRR